MIDINLGALPWHFATVIHLIISLGMRSPFSAAGVQGIEAPLFRQRLGAEYKSVWANLHVSPRVAPEKGVKLCTYLRWFARPGGMPAEPYFELPIL